jgi:hypothetical protein
MPQEPVEPYEAAYSPHVRRGPDSAEGPRWRFRATFTYGDDVIPPQVPGEVAIQTVHEDRSSANMEIEAGVGRTDLGRIVLEERLLNDVKLRQNEWHVIHSWERTAGGWRHQ